MYMAIICSRVSKRKLSLELISPTERIIIMSYYATCTGDASETASYVSGASITSGLGSLLVFEFQESGITRHIAVDTTLDKPPKFRNATKLHISNDHVFVATSIKRCVCLLIMKVVPHHSYSTVVCEVCSKKIHRLLGKRNAYMCRGKSDFPPLGWENICCLIQ